MILKSLSSAILLVVLLISCSASEQASDSSPNLSAFFSDPAWDGISVPQRGICTQFGGTGLSPEIVVSNIPEEAEYLSATFLDRNSGNRHGVLEVEIESLDETIIPSVRQGTGGYIGPCSGGRGNRYEVVIRAEGTNSRIRLSLGRY